MLLVNDLFPTAVLTFPVVLFSKAEVPKATLFPVVFKNNARYPIPIFSSDELFSSEPPPIATFLLPAPLNIIAALPIAILSPPEVLFFKAERPIATLVLPKVFEANALFPMITLFESSVTPALTFVNPEPSPTKAEAETVPEVWTRVTLALPSWTELLVVTIASAPMAVAFVIVEPLTVFD